MLTSELIKQLELQIAKCGDKKVYILQGKHFNLNEIKKVDWCTVSNYGTATAILID